MEAEGKADLEKQREAAEKLGQEVDELQVQDSARAPLIRALERMSAAGFRPVARPLLSGPAIDLLSGQ